MEKLRKRYSDERRQMSAPSSLFWPDGVLERGPMPTSARPLALVPPGDNVEEEDENNEEPEDEDEEEEKEKDEAYRSKSRSINYILRKPTILNRFSDARFVHKALNNRKRKEKVEEEEEELEERERGKGAELKLAREIRAFTERIVTMERKKIEMMDTEKWRMEGLR